jgi:lysophosphatidylglycerol acyltransferase 1
MTFAWHKPCTSLVNLRKHRLSDIPTEETSLTNWLYDRYSEKDELLKNYYSSGELPASSKTLVYLKTKPVWTAVHLSIYIISLYYVYQLLSLPLRLIF